MLTLYCSNANEYIQLKNFQVWRHLGRQFGPVIEPAGKDRFLDDHPAALLRKLNSQIPCLMGVVADEGLIGFHSMSLNQHYFITDNVKFGVVKFVASTFKI